MVQDHWPVGSEPQFLTTLSYSWTQRHGGDSTVDRGWRRCPNRYNNHNVGLRPQNHSPPGRSHAGARRSHPVECSIGSLLSLAYGGRSWSRSRAKLHDCGAGSSARLPPPRPALRLLIRRPQRRLTCAGPGPGSFPAFFSASSLPLPRARPPRRTRSLAPSCPFWPCPPPSHPQTLTSCSSAQ